MVGSVVGPELPMIASEEISNAKTKLFEFNSSIMLNKSIPKDANLMTATFSKMPVGMLKPKSRASLAYKDLAEEIINRSFTIF